MRLPVPVQGTEGAIPRPVVGSVAFGGLIAPPSAHGTRAPGFAAGAEV